MGEREASGADTGVKYLALGIGIGALLGLAAGLLLAPKPGEETRAELAEAVKKASDKAKAKLAEVKLKVEETVEKHCNDMKAENDADQAGTAMPAKE